ncbi:hypothetical protein [Micromonospora sp. DH14]|uniref:hypothetical protein n=1 Tax=Micromonospora sp. DH14 TaxID=3040120 RepID=UPI002441596F|nr:hypothetical protein [Micromonospora sp. DH14]MDG9676512.1 hypothetical protein [Micromonospora sp. DH14]
MSDPAVLAQMSIPDGESCVEIPDRMPQFFRQGIVTSISEAEFERSRPGSFSALRRHMCQQPGSTSMTTPPRRLHRQTPNLIYKNTPDRTLILSDLVCISDTWWAILGLNQ